MLGGDAPDGFSFDGASAIRGDKCPDSIAIRTVSAKVLNAVSNPVAGFARIRTAWVKAGFLQIQLPTCDVLILLLVILYSDSSLRLCDRRASHGFFVSWFQPRRIAEVLAMVPKVPSPTTQELQQ